MEDKETEQELQQEIRQRKAAIAAACIYWDKDTLCLEVDGLAKAETKLLEIKLSQLKARKPLLAE